MPIERGLNPTAALAQASGRGTSTTARRLAAVPAALIAGVVLSGCAALAPRDGTPVAILPPAAPTTPICFGCFWQYQPAGFRDELARWYEAHPMPDALLDADRQYLIARVRDDRAALVAARQAFLGRRDRETDPARRLIVDETLAFTAAECGDDVGIWFGRAAESARRAGQAFKADVYRRVADGTFVPRFGEAPIQSALDVPDGTTAYVLGESVIRVTAGEKVGVQMERTVRDWLSYRLGWDLTERSPAAGELIPWHEGSRLHDILEAVPATVMPLSGILIVRHGERWLAADDQGVFRFEVLIDKMQYPTTRVYGDLALMVDTHGISSLVEAAVRRGARLVVGCGDTPYKAQAAWWLAAQGIDVYFPCDRVVGDLLGYRGKGTLIGSAPVRAENGTAVIGDRPIRFSVWETVVAMDCDADGGFQYYNAPARYFRRLAASLPLKLDVVTVHGPDQTQAVVDRARAIGADVIAVRVRTDEDARAVREWLSGASTRRVVLFHTAPYPAGYALFGEFPKQTTFGDPRPRFIAEKAAYESEPGR